MYPKIYSSKAMKNKVFSLGACEKNLHFIYGITTTIFHRILKLFFYKICGYTIKENKVS